MNKMKNILIVLAVNLAIIAVFNGCESSGGSVDSDGLNNKYTLNGFFVQNVNLTAQKPDYNHFAAKMTRDTIELSTAQLFLGTSALVFDTTYNISDSVYTFSNSPRGYKTPEATILNIIDSTLYADTVLTTVLDSIWLTSYPDSTIPNTNGTSISIVWSSALGIEGYIVAVVLADSAYKNVGYSAYAELSTSATIPPDAFRVNNVVQTGWYNIYVYGYTGSPDQLLSAGVLPVAFPSQLPNNISHTNLSGNFGSIVVSRKKMIQVIAE